MNLNLKQNGMPNPAGPAAPANGPANPQPPHDVPAPEPHHNRVLVTLEHLVSDAALAANSRRGLFRLFGKLGVAFLFFYVLADWTVYTTGQIHPGELVFNNTMIQLWTATYRLVFMDIAVVVLLYMTSPVLWAFFRPDKNHRYDLGTAILNDLTPQQRIWLFFIVFYANAYLFVQLLQVKLPESVSVTP